MRVALIFDMEGVAHIDDPREPLPMYAEYWRTGREKLTNDIVAAARGLLDGGASEVLVLNHHGAGDEEWPNAMVDRFPDRVRPVPEDLGKRGLRDRVDSMFHVGAHARGGSQSFLSHTLLPGLRLRFRGELLSESHWWAWTGVVPVLGMVGSVELGAERGSLEAVPFLGVQQSSDRRTARAVFDSPADTASAIRSFAKHCARDALARQSMTPAGHVILEASLQNGEHVEAAMSDAGWRRTGPTEFRIEADGWRDESETIDNGIRAAAGAAFTPYGFWFDGLDATSEEAALAFPPDRLARSDAMLRSWAADRTVEWITPESARSWEGMSGHGAAPDQ